MRRSNSFDDHDIFFRVYPSKYEKRDPNIKNYWKKYFERLEQKFVKKRDEFPLKTEISKAQVYQDLAEEMGLPHAPVQFRDTASAESQIPLDLKILPDAFYSTPVGKRETLEPRLSSVKHRKISARLSKLHKLLMELDDTSSLFMRSLINLKYDPSAGQLSSIKEEKFQEKMQEHKTDKERDFKKGEEEKGSEFDDLQVFVDGNDLRERFIIDMDSMQENICGKTRKKRYTKNQKIFLEFLHLSPKKAANWRVPEQSTIEELNELSLPERAAYIEDSVATEFCDWLDSLGGKKSDLNATTLKELFQIGIVNPSSTSIRSHCEEKTCVPESIAKAMDIPEKSFRNTLLHQLHFDLLRKNLTSKTCAFNKSLPLKERISSCDTDELEEWLLCKTISPELYTFEKTFADILHWRSLDAYCHFLLRDPNYIKPAFLVNIGIFQNIQSSDPASCPHRHSEIEDVKLAKQQKRKSVASIGSEKSA